MADKADLTKLSDDELAAMDADLAEQRTAIRERQVALANERSYRAATASLSPSQREALQVRVGGSLGSKGEGKA